jgi:hypothetical protein
MPFHERLGGVSPYDYLTIIFIFSIISAWSWYNFKCLSSGKEAKYETNTERVLKEYGYRTFRLNIYKLSSRGKKFFMFPWLIIALTTTTLIVYMLWSLFSRFNSQEIFIGTKDFLVSFIFD